MSRRPLYVHCPTCGAAAGSRCVDLTDKHARDKNMRKFARKLDEFHLSRSRLADSTGIPNPPSPQG